MPQKKQLSTRLNAIPLWVWGALLAVLFFALYSLTMPLTNVGYADSDELITVAYNAGVAHPPGYPLYILLLNLFLGVPFGPTPAATAHLFSVFLATITLFLIFLTASNLYRLIKSNKKDYVLISPAFERPFLATITTASLGLCFLFWRYAHVAEKQALTVLFVGLIMFLYSVLFQPTISNKKSFISWASLWFVFGLGVNHYQPLVLLLIPNLMLIWIMGKKHLLRNLIIAFILAVAGFAISVAILWQLNQTGAAVSWNFTPTLQGLVGHITRQDFSGEVYAQGDQVQAYFGGFDLSASLSALWQYTRITIDNFGIWIVLIAIAALRFGISYSKKPFIILLTAFVLVGPLLAGYLKYPEDWGSQAISQRQFLASYPILALLLIYGWLEYIRRLGRSLVIITKPKIVPLILIAVPVLIFSYQLIRLYPIANLRSYDHISLQYQSIYEQLQPNAIVTCYSDISCFALLYQQYVLSDRNDVDIVPLAYPLVQSELNQAQLQGFTYPDNPFLFLDIVSWNLDKRPIYAVDISDFYYNFFGLEFPYMFYLPLGYHGQLTRQLPAQLPSYDPSLTAKWLETPTYTIDPMRMFHKITIGRNHTINGKMYLLMDRRRLALEEFNKATNVYFQLTDKEKEQITQVRNGVEQVQAKPEFELGSRVPTAQYYLDFLPDLIGRNMLNRAYRAALAAVISEPDNPQARLALAQLYQTIGDLDFANLEFIHTLMLDPDNQGAQAGLSELRQ